MTLRNLRLATALVIALSCTATAQVAILQIQVVEGDRAVHAPGSRSAIPLTVRVSDESGKPVAGAAVSFHLPEDGPSGAFAGGLRTEVAVTDAQGRVTLRGLRLNRIPGTFPIRIIASKEQARAGVVSTQFIAEPGSGVARAHSGRRNWIAVLALVGGGAAAGILAAGKSDSGSAAPAAAPQAPAIGPPSISVGKP